MSNVLTNLSKEKFAN